MEEKYIISKEDMKKYFKNNKEICREELIKYYKTKRNFDINFNAIFNATPRKNYKKRSDVK